jgi:hypothetical protein
VRHWLIASVPAPAAFVALAPDSHSNHFSADGNIPYQHDLSAIQDQVFAGAAWIRGHPYRRADIELVPDFVDPRQLIFRYSKHAEVSYRIIISSSMV